MKDYLFYVRLALTRVNAVDKTRAPVGMNL